MQKKIVLRIIILALIIIWMATVFGFSNQNASESSNLSRKIASVIVQKEEQINKVEPYIRKLAHLSEYAIGGMLFLSLFLTYEISDLRKMAYSFVLGFLYATVDEIHQLFVDGRAGRIEDVLIDSIGVAIGICVLMLFVQIIKKG